MRCDFAIEPLSHCWQDCLGLAVQHWSETESYRHGQPFNPNLALYLDYERRGLFIMGTARSIGQLMGYAGMYICPSAHTQQLVATEDTYFLLPEARKGRIGIAFVKFMEQECAARGAIEIVMTAKLTNRAGRLLDYLGYTVVAHQYSKPLIPIPRADSPPTPSVEAVNVRTESPARA